MNRKLSSLIEAERAQSPTAAGVERSWERLIRAVESGMAPMPLAATPLRLGSLSLVGKASMTFVVGAAVGTSVASMGLTWLGPPRTTDDDVVTSAASRRPEATEGPKPIASESPSPKVEDWPAAPATAPGSAPAARPSAEAERTSTLELELELVRQAREKLDSANPSGAWAILEKHAERFPGGALRLEREGLRVLSRCAMGPAAEGQKAGRAFVESYPDSPMLDRVKRACKVE